MAARMGDLLLGESRGKGRQARGKCHNCSFSGSSLRGGCQQGRDESIKLVHVHVRATYGSPNGGSPSGGSGGGREHGPYQWLVKRSAAR